MTSDLLESRATPHTHGDCGSRERVWLARERNAPASATLHPYCVTCGTVRNLAWPRARPLGYFLSGVEALREYLEHEPLRPKLAQVQSRLITTRLAARPEFEDPYGTPGQVQLDVYVRIVSSVRSDLDEELILRLLPGPRRRRQGAASKGDAPSTDVPRHIHGPHPPIDQRVGKGAATQGMPVRKSR